jgi:transcriptional regulator with XRE-family HTH domain
VPDQAKFFRALGERVRELRRRKGYSQEDMIDFGFSARHWQQIEGGRPITVTTLLRISEVFQIPIARLVSGLDRQVAAAEPRATADRKARRRR